MIYFDNAATTQMLEPVVQAMEPYYKDFYGNASSPHEIGIKSKKAIDESREIIASMIGANPQEIYFTSGGSESNSWIIKGFVNPFKLRPMHIISDTQEHHSIIESLIARQEHCKDIEYTLVSSDTDGYVDIDDLIESFQLNSKLCSIQMVNNETGIIQPIQQIAFKCNEESCWMHSDATQAFGYLNIDVKKLGLSFMTASAHKLHGPKGIGFLYISDEARPHMRSLINGGQQERGLRASTENVAAIVGFGKAAEIANKTMARNYSYIKHLSEEFVKMLSHLPGVHTNVDLRLTDYRHVSIRLDGVRAEEMLALLDSVGICVSSGSACNSSSHRPSHVLKAIGLSDESANSTIRVSFCETNTLNEIYTFVEQLKYFLEILRGRN